MKNRVTLLVIVGVVLAVGLITFEVIKSSRFHLVRSDPSNGSREVSGNQNVTFYFNRELATSDDGGADIDSGSEFNTFSISPSVPGNVKIRGKQITFQPGLTGMVVPQTYTARISHIKSKQGETLGDISITFTTEYVPFSNQSSSNQQQQINQTDQYHDSDTARNKFIKRLPYSTDNYSINYIVDGDYFLVRITNQPVKTYKAAALKYMASQGIVTSKEHIEYFILRGLE